MWIQYILILVTSLLTKLISLNENVGWVSGIFPPRVVSRLHKTNLCFNAKLNAKLLI